MDQALTITYATKDALIAALSWQVEAGADEALLDKPAFADDMMVTSQQILASEEASPSAKMMDNAPTPTAPSSNQMATPITTSSDTQIQKAQTVPPARAADLTSIDTLAELRSALEAFEGCDLKRTASNLVFADGNPQAKIMIIGEAPGRDEDRVGLPFVGKAGQLLDQMLSSIHLSREDVYITNILPWRPPGNRTPTSEETDMMRPFLNKHIQLMAPDIILAVGGTSAKTMLSTTTGIMKLRGKLTHYDIGDGVERPLLPMLHPAYLLRAPHHKHMAFADLVTLARKAKELAQLKGDK